MLVKVPDLQTHVAKAVRAELAETNDSDRLKDYEFLWGLEFRTTSPKDFAPLRQQVAEDVKRQERIINPHPDADWVSLLLHGSQQAGATPDAIRAREDVIIARYPHSGNAQGIVWKRWKVAQPEPTDSKDATAWKRYNDLQRAEQLKWLEQYPDQTNPPDYWRLLFMES